MRQVIDMNIEIKTEVNSENGEAQEPPGEMSERFTPGSAYRLHEPKLFSRDRWNGGGRAPRNQTALEARNLLRNEITRLAETRTQHFKKVSARVVGP